MIQKSKANEHSSANQANDKLVSAWYKGAWWLYLLLPLSVLYWLVSVVRKCLFLSGVLPVYHASVPVIVVGNISLGGTGKSPLTAALVSKLREQGYFPGIASRGYGANLHSHEYREVLQDSAVAEVGDEPMMLKAMLDCPVFVSPKRSLAVEQLEKAGCDVVICDDGLQHYALNRDIEICVFDGARGLGNGLVLPSGPLRESGARAKKSDYIIINGSDSVTGLARDEIYRMDLVPDQLVGILSQDTLPFEAFRGKKINAVAGIGNPERFFSALESYGIQVLRHPFADHHKFGLVDFEFEECLPIIMTEKDAIKCRDLGLRDAWFMPVTAKIEEEFFESIVNKVAAIKRAKS